MKFDVVIGNPPYQLKVGERKTQSIWDKFSFKLMKLLNKDGYLSLIHPGGWREPFGKFKNVQELYKSKNLVYLDINDYDKGKETFGVGTDYDWFLLENKDYEGTTTINFNDGEEIDIDISTLDFIPNENYELFKKLLPKTGEDTVEVLYDSSTYDSRKCNKTKGKYEIIYTTPKTGEDTVEVLYSRSAYGSDKKNISKCSTTEFIYPVVYTTLKDGTINLLYSNVNDNGHFGIPKVIFTNGAGSTPIVDKTGFYGLSQFAYGIIDKPENLDNIKKALDNPEFIKLFNGHGHKYNRKIISCLKKDFWKEFI